MALYLRFTLALGFLFLHQDQIFAQSGTFTIDRPSRTFLKDGEPFQYVAGCFHYFRATTDMWKGIMTKMKEGGLNVLETYVEWSSHEPEPGVYNFEGNLDLVSFVKMAQEVGLLVILRPGPYICAERDFGGLPYWLLREKPDMDLRTMDPVYIQYVDAWFDVLLPMMEPLLYQNGGPIILVQVENEYGQYPKCDREYMTHLRDLNRKHLGDEVILFRTNVPRKELYECDQVEGVEITADFGPGTDVEEASRTIHEVNPGTPLVVTEFYAGWMDHWGQPHGSNDMKGIRTTLESILANKGSVAIYMYYGGTNYGFSNGANAPFAPQPTSYDYAAPISEAGDTTDIYYEIRDVVSGFFPLPPVPPSQIPTPKLSTDPVRLHLTATLLKSLPMRGNYGQTTAKYPLTFEALGVAYGFVAYSVKVPFTPQDPCLLSVPGLRDRGYVYVDDQFVGIVSRHENVLTMSLLVRKFQTITIVVENQGRINYGVGLYDPKGLLQNVTLSDQVLTQWTMTPIPLTNIDELQKYPKAKGKKAAASSFQPAFYTGTFTLPKEAEEGAATFLDPSGWYRGVAFLNGFNLGRYWPVIGPQVTLFVPGSVLKPHPHKNVLTLLELEKAPCSDHEASCSVNFARNPILNGPVPTFHEETTYLNFSKLYQYERQEFLNIVQG